jgi:multicomponent Na+:H+ antiporter subunit G
MLWFAEMISYVLIVLGSFFYVVGAIGIYRMPDVFTRMHAAGISDTAGAGLLLTGMMLFAVSTNVSIFVIVKLAIILGVILVTSPIATHALAQAALHAGLEPILASKKVMIGPGAHAEPEKTPRKAALKKSAKKRAKPGSAKRASKPSPRKRRARS